MSLLDDLAIDYEPWRPHDHPDHPQGIEGLVKDRQVWSSDYGTFDVLMIVTDEGNPWSWAALGAIATREVSRRDPQPGDRIGVAYKGELEAPVGDKPMHVFRVLTIPGPDHVAGYRPPPPVAAPAVQPALEGIEGSEPF